jgi:glycosyltransferase involved in cell wall biosynthesis
MKPLISVIMPVYNCEKTIETAIRSILSQTYSNLELIVVDDASTDSTKTVVDNMMKKDPRVRLVDAEDDPHRFDARLNRNINAGYSARNTGFKHAKGECVTFQDADDASLLNRLEIQLGLLEKYKATHLTMDWLPFDERLVGTAGKAAIEGAVTSPDELFTLSQKTKGLVAKISPALNRMIPFWIKRLRFVNKVFFGSLAPFPGAGNSPLFRREVIEKVRFRKLSERVWPSFMGRGADRDFNFQVAETFKNSYVVPVKLYMWRK